VIHRKVVSDQPAIVLLVRLRPGVSREGDQLAFVHILRNQNGRLFWACAVRPTKREKEARIAKAGSPMTYVAWSLLGCSMNSCWTRSIIHRFSLSEQEILYGVARLGNISCRFNKKLTLPAPSWRSSSSSSPRSLHLCQFFFQQLLVIELGVVAVAGYQFVVVPSSTIHPWCRTAMRSALRTVETRCEMKIVVRRA